MEIQTSVPGGSSESPGKINGQVTRSVFHVTKAEGQVEVAKASPDQNIPRMKSWMLCTIFDMKYQPFEKITPCYPVRLPIDYCPLPTR